MKAIILAAGEGVRMRPLTLEKPKPMLEVLGKPLIQHIWETLPEEVNEVIVVVGYKGDMIRDFLGEEFLGKKVTILTQKEKLGTADAIMLAKDLLKSGERFLLMYADDLHDKESIARMLKHPTSILVKEVADPRKFGVVEIDTQGHVTGIEEKPENPKTNLAAIGGYLLDTKIFDYFPEKHPSGEYFLTDMIEKYIHVYPMVIERSDFWHPVGYPVDLETAVGALNAKKELVAR